MAVPITNMKISDIVAALGEATENITLRNLHLSHKVIGTGLDPTYCSGADGYARLANLRDLANVGGIRELRIGKFRNYNPPSVFYRSGFLYNGFCLWPNSGQYGLHIPDGWHIATYSDMLAIIQHYESTSNFLSNTAAKYLRCTYNPADIIPAFTYKPVWAVGVNKYDTDGFKLLATGLSFINFDEDPAILTWSSIGSTMNIWVDGTHGTNTYPAIQVTGSSDLLAAVTLGFTGPPSYNGRNYYCNIRLVKDDSINPGFVEDINGHVYPTIQIGDIVITSENIRTTINSNGDDISEATLSTPIDTEPAFLNSSIYDIP